MRSSFAVPADAVVGAGRHYAAPGGGARNTSCLRATSTTLGISIALPTSRSIALKKVDAPAREFTLRKRVPGDYHRGAPPRALTE